MSESDFDLCPSVTHLQIEEQKLSGSAIAAEGDFDGDWDDLMMTEQR